MQVEQMVGDFTQEIEVPGEIAPVSEDVNTQTQAPAVEAPAATQVIPPGSKTDPALLLRSLSDERAKRRELEAELQKLQSASSSYVPEDMYSDEGKILKQQIDSLTSTISKMEVEKQEIVLFGQYPELKENTEGWEQFKATRPGYSLEDSAKLFLAEKGLLTKPRKGLEPHTSSGKHSAPVGMTPAEVEHIRINQPKRYLKMMSDGAFDNVKY